MTHTTLLLVNFGGPRSQEEISPFLQELLCDTDVIRNKLPLRLHRFLFRQIAKRRAKKIAHDYALIGGGSPIFFDTEFLKEELERSLNTKVISFHRYLPSTHKESLEQIERCSSEEIKVLPLFPQFTFATSGSIARFFSEKLSKSSERKLNWIRSYGNHPAFIALFEEKIRTFLEMKNLKEEDVFLLFSAHGLPQTFIDTGDSYQRECEESFRLILEKLPKALGKLSFQSKFGRGAWIQPYTDVVATNITNWTQGRKHVVFIPLSFTSDHIETLFEVEELYLPLIREQNLQAYRCPAFNRDQNWIETLSFLSQDKTIAEKQNNELIFQP